MVLSVLGHFRAHTMRSINILQQKLYETFSKYVVLGNNICQEFFCHSVYILYFILWDSVYLFGCEISDIPNIMDKITRF